MRNLFWWMVAGSVFVWAAVLALVFWAVRSSPKGDRREQGQALVLIGALSPVVVLAMLLVAGVSMLPA